MSNKIDERVVEMRFDNAQFEKNVSTTMSTLDKLKKSLNLDGAAKGLQNVNAAAKTTSFDSLAASVSKLEYRFSTLGIVGMRVIENLTDSMMRLAQKTLNFLTSGVVQGGIKRAMNLENAHFQLQGLLKDEEAVAAVMQNVGDSVDGTAYSLDSAAKVASQLAASGMRAGDDMFKSLRAVAGVAAMTNSEYDDIGRIFTKVAGQGRLMGDDLLSLSSRGMNAAATLAESMGITESAVREMVSKGQIDFKTFAYAMDDAFGEHAKKANETLTGALSNVKAALARIGALFVSPLVEQNGELVQLLNNVRVKINDIKETLVPVANYVVNILKNLISKVSSFVEKLDVKKYFSEFSKAFTSSKWDVFVQKINDAGIATDKFQEKLKEVASRHGISIDNLIEKYGTLGKVMAAGKLSKSIIIETLKEFISVEEDASEATADVTNKLEYFNKIINEVIRGNYGSGADRMKALADAGYDYAQVQKLINYVWERNGKTWSNCTVTAEELTNVIGDLSTEELKSIGYTDEQAKKIRELAEEAEKTGTPLNELISSLSEVSKPSAKVLIIDTLKNGLQGLYSIIKALKDAFFEIFDFSKASGAMYSFLELIHELSEKFVFSEKRADKLKRTFKGLFAIIDILRMVIGGGLNIVFKILKAVLSAFNIDVLDLTAIVGDVIVKFRDWIKEHNLLSKAIGFLAPIIKTLAIVIKDAALAAYDWAKNNKSIQNILKTISNWFEKSSESVKKWIDGLKETDNIPKYIISGLVNGLKSGISTVSSVMVELGRGILDAIKGVLGIHSPSTEFFEIGVNVVLGFVKGIQNGVSLVWEALMKLGKMCIDAISSIDFGEALFIAFVSSILLVVNKVIGIVDKIATPFVKFGEMFESIGNSIKTMFSDIGNYFKAKKIESISIAIRNFAISIAILAASVAVMTFIAKDHSAEMWEAFGLVIALGALLAGLSVVLGKWGPKEGWRLALFISAFSMAMINLALALKIMGGISPEQMGMATWGVALLAGLVAAMVRTTKYRRNLDEARKVYTKIGLAMIALAIALKIMGGISPEQMGMATWGVALLAGLVAAMVRTTKYRSNLDEAKYVYTKIGLAMLALAIALKIMGSIDPDQMGMATWGVLLVAAFVAIMVRTTKYRRNLDKVQEVYTKIGLAMMALAVALKIMGSIDPDQMGMATWGVLLVAAFVAIMVRTTKERRNLDKVQDVYVKIGLAMMALAVALKIMSSISSEQMKVAVLAMAALTAFMSALIYVTKKCNKDAPKIGETMLAISGAIVILAVALRVLSGIGWDQLFVAVAGMIALSAVVTYLVYITQQIGKDGPKITATLTAMAGAIAILAAVAVLLGLIEFKDLAKGVGAVAILGLIVGHILKVANTSKDAIKPLITMVVVIGLLGGVLYLLSTIKTDSILASAVSLTLVLAALVGALNIINKTDIGAGTGKKLIAITFVLLAISAACLALAPALSTLGSMSLEEIAKGLLAIAGVFVILGTAGYLLAEAIPVITRLGIAIGTFAIACLAVGAGVLAFAEGLKVLSSIAAESARSILETLEIIIVGILELSVSVAGALTEAIISWCQVFIQSMPAISEAIRVFILNISKVLVKSIPVIVESAARVLVGVLKALTKYAPQLVDGLVNLIIAVLGALAPRLPELIASLTNFLVQLFSSIGDNIRPIIDVLVELFGTIFKGLIDSFGGIVKSVLAPILDIIADLFVRIVEVIAPYIPVISDAITEIVPVISDAITKIVQAIAPFIPDMRMMVETISEYVQKIVDAIVAIVQQIAPVIDTITKLVKQVGDTFVDVFGEVEEIITKVGDALDKVLQGVSDVLNGVADVIDEVGDTIEESLGGLSDTVDSILGGVAEVIDSFSGVIEEVLSPLNNLINGIFGGSDVEVDPSAVKKSIEYIAETEDELGSVSNILFDIAESIETIGNYSGNLHFVAEDMKDLSKKVKPTLNHFTGLAAAVASASSDMLTILDSAERSREAFDSMATSFRVAMKSIESAYSAYGESVMGKMVEGIRSGASKIKISMLLILIETVTIAASTADKFLNVGKSLAASFANGIKSGSSEAKTAFASVLSESVSNIKSYYEAYYGAGSYLVDGFVDGINKNSFKAKTAASEMAKAAKEEIKKILKINSPSKVFRDIGYSVPEGFAMGIDRMSRLVAGSAKNMAGSALDSTKKALSNVVRMMNSDISTQPTIRPVLDLSDVSAGAGAINGMFNMTPSVGVMSNIGTISSMMNRVQNGANDDVISAIKDLGRTIGNVSGDTYQINGITYDDGTEVSDAIGAIVRAARIERRR